MLCLAIVASYKRTLESICLAMVRGGNLQGLRNLIVFDRVAHSFKSCSLYLCFECRFTCQCASETLIFAMSGHIFLYSVDTFAPLLLSICTPSRYY